MATTTTAAAPVTVVIAAKNEARHVAECVASVRWAAEVLVVEDGSTDDTVALALGAGAAVVRNHFITIGAQRNVAIARAANRWVLVVDADERCTPALAAEIARVLHDVADAAPRAWRVPRRNYFLRRRIDHGGWERDRPVRLFDRALRYDERPVHEHVVTGDAAVATLAAPLEHYTYDSLAQFFAKLDTYSRWWAEQHHARGRRASALTVLLRPVGRFLGMYLLKLGFLDGAHGLVLAVLSATSVAAKYARLWAMDRTPASQQPPSRGLGR